MESIILLDFIFKSILLSIWDITNYLNFIKYLYLTTFKKPYLGLDKAACVNTIDNNLIFDNDCYLLQGVLSNSNKKNFL